MNNFTPRAAFRSRRREALVLVPSADAFPFKSLTLQRHTTS